MRSWSQRSLKSMEGIHPDLRRVLDDALQGSPHDFVITEGLRSIARQKEMVRIGASKTMNSRHITGHAVDLYGWIDIDADGTVEFVEMSNVHILTAISNAIKASATKLGVPIIWGGDWRKFRDLPHFELNRKAYP